VDWKRRRRYEVTDWVRFRVEWRVGKLRRKGKEKVRRLEE
jgi:hypothetical protein